GGMNWPISGGGYFRLLPYAMFRHGLRRLNRVEAQAAIFFIHPWEVDPDQPLVPGTHLNVWRHRLNLHRTLPRLERLLNDFRFAPAREVLWNAECGMRNADWGELPSSDAAFNPQSTIRNPQS